MCRRNAVLSEQSSTESAVRERKSDRSVSRYSHVVAAVMSLKYVLHLLNASINFLVLHPHFFRMRELVRRRRRPRGEQKMMLRRRKPSPVSTLEATCRSW